MANKEQVLKRLKTAIIILLIIFAVSFMALAARIIYVSFYADRDATVVVPDNILDVSDSEAVLGADASAPEYSEDEGAAYALSNILCDKPAEPRFMLLTSGTSQAKVIELYRGQSADNDAFNAQNMFPGDTVTKYYCLKVYHRAYVAVRFDVTDITETKSLGNILNIKVTKYNEDGSGEEVVCNDSFNNIKGTTYNTVFSVNATKETIAYYKIEVSLPTSAGNEYQGASLSADFNWYAEDPGTPPTHICESKCPVCGKCLDKTCTDPVCVHKCQGHSVTPPAHTCESKCPTCGKCLDSTCTYPACADKCPGHAAHACESKCPVCGKCLDKTCTDPACRDKCPGHGSASTHACSSICRYCGGCLDAVCTDPVCADKCPGQAGTIIVDDFVFEVDGALPCGVEIIVNKIEAEEDKKAIADALSGYVDSLDGSEVFYEIYAVKDGVRVDLSKEIRVTLDAPIPGVDDYVIYRVKEDNSVETVYAKAEDGKISFYIDGLSNFVFADNSGQGAGEHICIHECPECGKCLDMDCKHEICAEKCDCPTLIVKPKRYLIWPWTIVPALSLTSSVVLIIIFFKKKKEEDDENDQ